MKKSALTAFLFSQCRHFYFQIALEAGCIQFFAAADNALAPISFL